MIPTDDVCTVHREARSYTRSVIPTDDVGMVHRKVRRYTRAVIPTNDIHSNVTKGLYDMPWHVIQSFLCTTYKSVYKTTTELLELCFLIIRLPIKHFTLRI